jgi:3'-phosphoadenosine 5'-phosphosulfate sulfotransferase (PAPS reductase)/FAD synthetase
MPWPTGEETIRQVAKLTDIVMLSVSCGKDSLAMFLACRPHFKTIVPVHFVKLPGIGFTENYLDYLEDKMGSKIVRVLDPNTILYFQRLIFQSPESSSVIFDHPWPPHYWYRGVTQKVRADLKLPKSTWIGFGIRSQDSFLRAFVLKKHGPMAHGTREFKPVWDWTTAKCVEIIRKSGVKLPVDYTIFGRSWAGYDFKYISKIREYFPEDYARIKKFFPMVDAQMARYKFAEQRPELWKSKT